MSPAMSMGQRGRLPGETHRFLAANPGLGVGNASDGRSDHARVQAKITARKRPNSSRTGSL
jgi:hypothetical protein